MSARSGPAVIRSVAFWIHLILGVVAGVVILALSLSGLLLGYERQVIEWIDGSPVVVEPGTTRLPLDALLERAGIPLQTVASLQFRADRTSAAIVRSTDPRRLPSLLNPYSGAMLPLPTQTPIRRTFAWIREWHLALGAPEGPLRAKTEAVSGATMLALVMLLPLGVYLWWPAHWNRAALRARLLLRINLRGHARNFNWHNSVGFWSAGPLFIVALTGVFLAYQWPTQWLDDTFGAAPAAALPLEVRPVEGNAASPSALLAAIETRHPAWQSITMSMAIKSSAPVQVVVAEGNTFRPDLRSTLLLDPVSAAVLRETTYASMDVSRRLRSWVRYSHTGEAFGLVGQTVATAASAGGVVLAWTGLALALRRVRRWRAP